MTPEARRKLYFTRYAANLSNMPFAFEGCPKYTNTFLCPFCQRTFSPDALLPPPKVTVEHCIPRALGGTDGLTTLICQKCNNDMGTWYDSHLANRMKAEEFLTGKSDAALRGHFEVGGGQVRSSIKIVQGEDGQPSVSVFFDQKRTDPKKWEVALATLGTGTTGPLEMQISADLSYRPLSQQIALLRIAYLMAFREFGYSYILNTYLDRVRQQIMTPGEQLIPYAYVIDLGKDLEQVNRVGIIESGDIRAFLVCVRLTAGKITAHKGILLPSVEEGGETLYDRLAEMRKAGTPVSGQFVSYASEIERLGEPGMLMRAYELWDRKFHREAFREGV